MTNTGFINHCFGLALADLVALTKDQTLSDRRKRIAWLVLEHRKIP